MMSLCPALTNLSLSDIVGVKIKLSDRFLFIITLYIPPSVTCDNYDCLFDSIESIYDMYGSDILIMGDFNIPEYAVGSFSRANNALRQFMNFYNLEQHNIIVNINDRILDVILCNMVYSVKKLIRCCYLQTCTTLL